MKKSYFAFLIVTLLLSSCSIFGIHFRVHNPRHEGKIPNFSEETILLGEMTKYRSCFDVNYYDLALTVNPDKKSISGIVEIHAQAAEDFDTLQIDLHNNFTINSLVELNTNKSLSFKRNQRAIFVVIPKKKSEKFTLKIDYAGKPKVAKKAPWKGGFVWDKDKEGNHWDGVACESIGASIWWPLKDHTADEPDSMRLHYTVPKGLMAIGNGQFEGRTDANEQSTFNWFISYPINTYNVTIYVGKFKKIEEEYTGIKGKPLEISHYVLEKNYDAAKIHFQQLHKHLALYEKRFGEYPWYNDGFKLVESPYAGMEHQTAIAYGNGYKNNSNKTDYIILHETAHEWWGNSVTAKDLAHVWLQEGFATYSEALYYEEAVNHEEYEREMFMNQIMIKNKYPLVVREGRRWFHYKQNSDVYPKGASVLHSLRSQIDNDSIFFDIIHSFAERNKRKIVESNDFIAVVNEKTNDDYDWFFNHYLYKNEAPELEYQLTNDGTLFYKWKNTAAEFNQLKVKFMSSGVEYTIIPSNELQSIHLAKDAYGELYLYFLNNVFYAKNKSLFKEKSRINRKSTTKVIND